jgi:hypothetical protein
MGKKDDCKRTQKPFGGNLKYGHLVWLDTDNFLTWDGLMRLISHDKDIMAGWYKAAPPGGNRVDGDNITCSGFFDYPNTAFVNPLTASEIEAHEEPFKVDFSGFGCIVIKYGVFESMLYPWFSYKQIEFIDEDGDECSSHEGEDVYWCMEAKRLGYEVWVDPKVRVPHYKKLMV